MQSASEQWFDEAYYQRYYFDKKTRVVDPAHAERLGAFVCSYLRYLRVPAERVLDMGCGIGLWQQGFFGELAALARTGPLRAGRGAATIQGAARCLHPG